MYSYGVHVQCCASDAINHAEVSCRVSICLKTELIDLIESVLFSVCCFITDGGFFCSAETVIGLKKKIRF